MHRDRSIIKGQVTVKVFDKTGAQKKRTTWNLKVFLVMFACVIRRQFQNAKDVFTYEMAINHNLVTDHGDALIVDMIVTSSARTPVDNANAVIGIGTGFVSTGKAITALVTQEGSDQAMESTYPKQKGAWEASDDNVAQYRSILTSITATAIDEAALGNGTDLLSYAEVTPNVNLVPADTIQVDWEITFLGT